MVPSFELPCIAAGTRHRISRDPNDMSLRDAGVPRSEDKAAPVLVRVEATSILFPSSPLSLEEVSSPAS